MWFKNLYLYRLASDFSCDLEELAEQMAQKAFASCASDQRESIGWVSPFGREGEAMFHAVNNFILLSMAHQERLLPGSVVKEELDERVQQLEEQEQRKVSSREKKDMREQIEFEFMPRAFTRTRKMDAWLDLNSGWLVINTSSAAQAERLTGLLRKTLGSLPITAPEAGNKAALLMTDWLKQSQAPAPFELGDECELRIPGDEGGVAVFKRHELASEEVMTNLQAGKLVTKLMLTWADKISFVLMDVLQIKRLKFLSVLEEKLNEQDPESYAERLDIEFTLMTGEVSQLLQDLFACFRQDTAKA